MSLCNDGASTTMLVQPATNGNCGNGGFGWGGDWASWIILFLIFGLFGFGGYGFGGFGGGFGGGYGVNGALTRGELCQDMNFQDVKNAVTDNGAAMQAGFRNVDNAVCQLGYNNAQLANGVQMQIASEGRGLDNAVCTLGYNTQLGFNTLGSQLSSCCCDIREGIQGVNYNNAMNLNALQRQISDCCCENRYDSLQQSNATQSAIRDGFCQTNYNNATNTRDIIESQNANTRAILDKLTQQEIAAKDAQIAAQNQRLFAAELAASQAAQTNALVAQLGPKCPVPAYPACSPYETPGYLRNGCGCNGQMNI